MHRHLLRILLASGLAASPGFLVAQTRAIDPVRVPIELQQMAARAGTIFSGRVVSILPTRPASAGGVATVTISFQVEDAVRGVKSGQNFSFREWAGLWSAGPRYFVGQHLMLFLYAPSVLGLTSPIDGRSGVLSIDTQGRVLLPPRQRSPGFTRSAQTAPASFRAKDVAIALRRIGED